MKFFLLFSILLIGETNGQGPIGDIICAFFPCPSGTKCQASFFIPRCVAIPTKPPTTTRTTRRPTTRTTTRRTPPTTRPPITCSVQCWPGLSCSLVYPYWCPPGCQPQKQCISYNPCRFTRCPFGYECVLTASFCTPPFICWPNAQCRLRQISPWPWGPFSREGAPPTVEEPSCKGANCTKPAECDLIKPLSCGDKNDTCPLKPACITENACVGHDCKNGTYCVLSEAKCEKAPCKPVAECDPIPNQPEVEPEGCGIPIPEPIPDWEGCKENEIFEPCITNCCDPKCNEKPKRCTGQCNGSGCVCDKKFYRDKSGKCVSQKECDAEKKGKKP